MNELEEFKKVLDNDENIIYSYKPNKVRFIWLNILPSVLISLIIGGIFFAFGFATGFISQSEFPIVSIIFIVIISLIVFMGSFGTFILGIIKFKKTYYVVTNKRLVIKSGIIGTDFRTLELKMVQLVDVRVGLLDKFIHSNTGTIIFGSASTPIVDYSYQRTYGNNLRNSIFSFANIDNPYEVAKQIKSHIDLNK